MLALLAASIVAPRAQAGVDGKATLADPFDDDVVTPDGFPDPLERVNRATFKLNLTLDRWFIDPVARA